MLEMEILVQTRELEMIVKFEGSHFAENNPLHKLQHKRQDRN